MRCRIDLNRGWDFRQLPASGAPEGSYAVVDLPHSPFVADLNGRGHWFGECEYQRTLAPVTLRPGERCVLWIGAAMQVATIFVDGCAVGHHEGGYLPFEVDLTDALKADVPSVLLLRLDNRHNPDIPPGKPFNDLDFCWYGGLYRGAELRIKPALHVTDPVAANIPAGGGVFIRTLQSSEARALVAVKVHAQNLSGQAQPVRVRVQLQRSGVVVASATSDVVQLARGADASVEQTLVIDRPQLWSPATPHLYEAVISVLIQDGTEIDSCVERFGVRRINFSRGGGFVINGRRLRLRGTNRHQDFPSVGYAAPRAAQFRDARRIKEAGFDYVRLAHYPQSPDFLDACDALGLVVMACIPGWQYFGGERFRAGCFENARQLIRRDRNHPCVVLWELSLNETPMEDAFIAQLHAIGHAEYPGDQMFTCGWIDRYDVFSHSRQHGEIHRWHNGDKALVIAEYGDWEFFARTEGFDQKSGTGLFDRWSTARQARSDGERGLRQQVFNHMVALNDTLASPAVLDGQWAMFDYARGYDPVRAAVGVMDIFRLPKFSYHFYRSQRDATESGDGWQVGPVVFIASHWTPISNLRLPVFSNCEEVELRLNGALIGRSRAGQTALTQLLPHPPFFFDIPRWVQGTLEAIGYIGGKPQATHTVATPGTPANVALSIEDLGISPSVDESDVVFAHARWVDANGTLCVEETAPIAFCLDGAAELVGVATVAAEAGIASIVIRIPAGSNGFVVHAGALTPGSTAPVGLRWTPQVAAPKRPAMTAALGVSPLDKRSVAAD
ncbi:MAG: glycoside hydrolase family 2 TIM barrel-domain containing protein [Opitutus sp.]